MKAALVLLFVGVALATPTGQQFGFNRNHIEVSDGGAGTRIVGGQDAEVGEYPWQISLQVRPLLGATYHSCGGTLLNETTVVCAAHCVDGQNVNRLEVVVGAYNVKDKTEASQQRVKVAATQKHPDYNSRIIINDVSIITLAEPVTLNENVQPLRLSPAVSVEDGKRSVNTGWGNSRPNGGTPAIVPDALQEVELTVISNEDCAARFDGINGVDDGMICAHNVAGGQGACNGDSGGPLLCFDEDNSPYLCGIVSWGMQPCAQAQYASVYTRVSKFLPFITGVSA